MRSQVRSYCYRGVISHTQTGWGRWVCRGRWDFGEQVLICRLWRQRMQLRHSQGAGRYQSQPLASHETLVLTRREREKMRENEARTNRGLASRFAGHLGLGPKKIAMRAVIRGRLGRDKEQGRGSWTGRDPVNLSCLLQVTCTAHWSGSAGPLTARLFSPPDSMAEDNSSSSSRLGVECSLREGVEKRCSAVWSMKPTVSQP